MVSEAGDHVQASHFAEPKTAASRRKILLPSDLVNDLRAHKREQAEERSRQAVRTRTLISSSPRARAPRTTRRTSLLVTSSR